MRVTLRLSEKDTLIRRWLELAHDKGESASEYLTIAIRYYLKYKKPLQLGTVRQAAYSNAFTTSFLIPDYLVDELDELAKQFGNYKRGRLIKTILNRCITLRKGYENEEMADLYELMDIMIHMNDEEPKSILAKESIVMRSDVAQDTKPLVVNVPQPQFDVNERVKEEPKSVETVEEKKTVKKEEGSKKTGNKLLGGLFPDIQDQMADWE